MSLLVVTLDGITDPAMNLALEEYCLLHRASADPVLLTYANSAAVIIGRHQNHLAQVDCDFADRRGIGVYRRISGGGAVYHDAGNLNFSLIDRFDPVRFQRIDRLLGPIVDSLNRLGVPASLSARNDILIRGKKITGTARYSNTRSMICHGTLLFSTDLATLRRVLTSPLHLLADRGVISTPSPVTNVADELPRRMGFSEFSTRIRTALSDALGPAKSMPLTAIQWAEVRRIAEEKYRRVDWNRNRSPACTIAGDLSLPEGRIPVHIDIEKGRVSEVRPAMANGCGPHAAPGALAALVGRPVEEVLTRMIHIRNDVPECPSTGASRKDAPGTGSP